MYFIYGLSSNKGQADSFRNMKKRLAIEPNVTSNEFKLDNMLIHANLRKQETQDV